MAISVSELENCIRTALPDAEIEISDLRGDGDHYAARVVSAAFVGKSRIEQHRMVYDAIRGGMGEALHALALQTATPTDGKGETQ